MRYVCHLPSGHSPQCMEADMAPCRCGGCAGCGHQPHMGACATCQREGPAS